MASRLVIVRHGETEWSRSGQHTGRTDIPLDAEGRERAVGLRAALAGWQFAAVFSSPLVRAWETVELAGLGDRAQPLDDLREWDYGDYEGLTTTQIRERVPGWVLWRDGVPSGETIEHVAQRADRVIALVGGISGDVLLISHGHMLRILTARWLEMPPETGARFCLGTGAPSELGYEHEWTALQTWNVPTGR